MEFRCEECGHVGAASGTKSDPSGILLTCGNCGHDNRLEVGVPVPVPVSVPMQSTKTVANAFADEAFDRFIPASGEGKRCPKCAHLVAPSDLHCDRCGLSLEGAYRFGPGEAPWEQPPAGKESDWDQAKLLWRAFEESGDAERFSRFADFVRENELHDMAARMVRFYLVDHPADENVLSLLREIAGSVHTRMMVAQAQAQANAADFSDVTQRARNVLLWGAFFFWLVILVVIVTRYMC
jgi:hypothetical protein